MLDRLGYAVHLVVTGRSLDSYEVEAGQGPFASIVLLQARRVWGYTLPWSLGGWMRLVRNRLRSAGLRGMPVGKRVEFGRPLPLRRQAAVLKRVHQVSAPLLFHDTLFRRLDRRLLPPHLHSVLIAHDVFAARRDSFEANGIDVSKAGDADESKTIGTFDGVLAISDADAAHFNRIAVGVPIATIYPVAGTVYPPSTPAQGHNILYLGTAAPHNVDGMRWFADSVWPVIRAAYDDVELHVVGDIAEALPSMPKGIILHGRLADISDIAGRCVAAINPLRMGSGLKIKVVDYMALALPAILTPVAAAGFPTRPPPPFLTAEGEAGFATAVLNLLRDDGARAALIDRMPAYLACFSVEAGASRLGRLIHALPPLLSV
jgi:hypothetical protein